MNLSAISRVFAVLAIAGASLAGQAPKTVDQRQNALALEQQGKVPEAETAWRIYLKAHPSSAEPYAHLGLLASRQQSFDEAISFYRKALKLGPDLPSVRLNLGLALFKKGDLKGSLEAFQPLLRSEPNNPQIVTLVGMAHYGLADYKSAVPYLRKSADFQPSNLPIRLALAHSCLWSKQNQCVLDVYKEILALDPESAEADMIAGEALDGMKDNEGSTKMFRAAVKANPKEPNAHFGLGYLLWTQKIFAEAASEFRAELANDPEHVQARLYLADTAIQMNKMDDALPLLETLEQQKVEFPLIHLDLGIIYAEKTRNEDALRELLEAEKAMPKDTNVHWRLARLYRSEGKKDQAKEEFALADRLTKAADDDLFNKIEQGQHRADPASPTASQTSPDPKPEN